MKTTIETITAEQCRALSREAAAAGDLTMAEMASRAERLIDTDQRDGAERGCILACVAAIADAEAQS